MFFAPVNKIIVTALCFLNICTREALAKENINQNFTKAISAAYDIARELNQFPGIDNSALKAALEHASSSNIETAKPIHEEDLQTKINVRQKFINALINQIKKNQKLRDISILLFSLLQLYKQDLIESLIRKSDSIFLEIEEALLSETIKQLRVKAISVPDENTKSFLKQTRFVLQPKKGAYILSLLKKAESIIPIQKSIQALIPLAENISAQENATSLLMPSEKLADLSQVFYSTALKIRSELPTEEAFRQADDLLEEILAINPEANKSFNQNNLEKDVKDGADEVFEEQEGSFVEENKDSLIPDGNDKDLTKEESVQKQELDEEVDLEPTNELNQTFVIKTSQKQTQDRPKKASKAPLIKKSLQPIKKNKTKNPPLEKQDKNNYSSEQQTNEDLEEDYNEEGPTEELAAEEQTQEEPLFEQKNTTYHNKPALTELKFYQAQQPSYQDESPGLGQAQESQEQDVEPEQNEQNAMEDVEIVEEVIPASEHTPVEEIKHVQPVKNSAPTIQQSQDKDPEEEDEEYLVDNSDEKELSDKELSAALEEQNKEPIKELLPVPQKESAVVPKKNQQDKNTHTPEKATSQEKTESDKKKEAETKKEQAHRIELEKSIKEKLANLKTQNKPALAAEPKKLDENLKTELKGQDQQEKVTLAIASDINTKTQEPNNSTPAQETKIEPAQESLKKPEPKDPQVKTEVAQETIQNVETAPLDKNQAIEKEKKNASEEQKPLAKTKIQSIKDKIKKLVKKISPDSKKNDQLSQDAIKALEPEAIAIKKTEVVAKSAEPETTADSTDSQKEAKEDEPAKNTVEATSANQDQEPAAEGSLEGQVDEAVEGPASGTQEEPILNNEQEPKKKKTVKQKLSGLFKKIKETVSKK